MRLVTWNVRGLGSGAKIEVVNRLVKMHRVNVCFIQKTKLEFVSVDIVRKILGDDNFGFIFATAIDRSGGLLTIWDKGSASIYSSNADLLKASSSWMVKVYCVRCGKKRQSGMWGVLRDKKGVTRALFSDSVTAYDVDTANASAVKTALDVFITMNWKIYDSLFIEIGSLVVLSWCVNKAMRHWFLQAMFVDIDKDLLKARKVVFSVADRTGNKLAASLAIADINRENLFKAWW
ncbi:hypothetical protein CXB51_015318 [Gossypium anomalum]|uniref:RNase H type-1 domain-containing protein n=1 Tax=Gossypium anomalum TaxID=47600 RepID=A0A8J5Z5J7_9ROSI|nr:hypothetical protein CXB51_015318 [Gossypium anomalum]